jgi:hypothetical protein
LHRTERNRQTGCRENKENKKKMRETERKEGKVECRERGIKEMRVIKIGEA